MRNSVYFIWLGWLALGIILKIVGLIGWGLALSALWLPIVFLFVIGILIFAIADIGERIKKNKEDNTPDECGNCLFGHTCDLINKTRKEGEEKEKCMGERIGGATRGVVCGYYKRVE